MHYIYCSLSNLSQLTQLWLSHNLLEHLPPPIYSLKGLKYLYLIYNERLRRIEEDILQLKNLVVLDCRFCDSLVFPPYAVCKEGLTAVQKYITDLAIAKGVKPTLVPVAIVGNTMSGKTSLVRSLQDRRRYLSISVCIYVNHVYLNVLDIVHKYC